MTTKLEELRKLAEEATPGPWSSYKRIVYFPTKEAGGFSLHECPRSHENADFIAAANPQTIFAMCDLLEQLAEQLRLTNINLHKGIMSRSIHNLQARENIEALAAFDKFNTNTSN